MMMIPVATVAESPAAANKAAVASMFQMATQYRADELRVDAANRLTHADGGPLAYSEQLQLYGSADLTAVNASELRGFIDFFNAHSPWINLERFELERDFVPIVMRANRRASHIGEVLARLARVERINRTVLIVSHDSLDMPMLNAISAIRFMVVRQIINPHSANVLLSRFPGNDEHTGVVRDQHGHGRTEAKFPGIKHHFLWHLAYVWRRLLPDHVSDVMLIEEDHIPTFDFYVASRSLIRRAEALCPDCGGVLAGHHARAGAHLLEHTVLGKPFGVGPWGSNANLGLSMSRYTWRMLLDNALTWCTFDDYNWDLSLERLRGTRNLQPYLLSMRWSRLLHYGICGSTHESRRGKEAQRPCEVAEREILAKIDTDIEPKLRAEYAAGLKLLLANATFVARRDAARRAALASQRYTHRFESDADARDVFWYRDDDDGIAASDVFVELADALWATDDLKGNNPGKTQGWGGFSALDQQLCVNIAGIKDQLLPRFDGAVADKDVDNAAVLERVVPALDKAVLVGCFVDKKWARDLGQFHGLVKSRMDCMRRCRVARLPIAGVQFGCECWCGLAYGLHGRVDEHECNMTCEKSGDSCGGPDRNVVFDLRPAI